MNMFGNRLEIVSTLGFMDLKLKYRSSKLGFLWSFLKPFLRFVVYYVVFAIFFKVGEGKDYALSLFLGVLAWEFFAEATGLGMNSYIGKKSIVTKINVEKVLMPISSYVTPALNFFLSFIIFFLLYVMFSFHNFSELSIGKLGVLILTFLDYSIIIISINIILANLNAIFRDIQNIWELILQYGVFMTPIIYPLPVPDQFVALYFSLNVLALPIELSKCQLFEYETKLFQDFSFILVGHLTVVLLLCLLAFFVHRKVNEKVVDYL